MSDSQILFGITRSMGYVLVNEGKIRTVSLRRPLGSCVRWTASAGGFSPQKCAFARRVVDRHTGDELAVDVNDFGRREAVEESG